MIKALRPSMMFLTAVIMMLMLFTSPVVKAEDEDLPSTAEMLIIYDDSFTARMSSYILSDPEERLTEMTKLAVIPFDITLGMDLEFTVQEYSDVFNASEYSKQCPSLYPTIYPELGHPTHAWNLDAQCTCYPNSSCYTGDWEACHHNSADGLVYMLQSYFDDDRDFDYDYAALFVGHKLCYYRGGSHGQCVGMGLKPGNAVVCATHGHVVSYSFYQVLNLISIKGRLSHEFSHNLNLPDHGGSTYSTSEPCTMAGGYSGIVYTRNIWCSDCLNALMGGE